MSMRIFVDGSGSAEVRPATRLQAHIEALICGLAPGKRNPFIAFVFWDGSATDGCAWFCRKTANEWLVDEAPGEWRSVRVKPQPARSGGNRICAAAVDGVGDCIVCLVGMGECVYRCAATPPPGVIALCYGWTPPPPFAPPI
jgi:hypothetical protein